MIGAVDLLLLTIVFTDHKLKILIPFYIGDVSSETHHIS